MNGSCDTPEEQLCGCCQGLGSETPEPISNRPGLSQIRYRVGTHATFKASLLAALSDSNLPALAPLRTRDGSDFSIALLDAWAVALDILTFYQERLANEAYLGTAVDAASVMSLARLVGYKPSPGVAASAFLAFTLTNARGAPDNVLIPAGTRVQSVPKPGQTPQVFETSSDLTAHEGRSIALDFKQANALGAIARKQVIEHAPVPALVVLDRDLWERPCVACWQWRKKC